MHRRLHTPNTNTHPPSPGQAGQRERPLHGVGKSGARVPPSVCVQASSSQHKALNIHRWPITRTQPPSKTPLALLVHSRVVTQQSSWLVMEPVSHPASINLTHPPPPPLTPHPSNPRLHLTKWPRESVGRRGPDGVGGGE